MEHSELLAIYRAALEAIVEDWPHNPASYMDAYMRCRKVARQALDQASYTQVNSKE